MSVKAECDLKELKALSDSADHALLEGLAQEIEVKKEQKLKGDQLFCRAMFPSDKEQK